MYNLIPDLSLWNPFLIPQFHKVLYLIFRVKEGESRYNKSCLCPGNIVFESIILLICVLNYRYLNIVIHVLIIKKKSYFTKLTLGTILKYCKIFILKWVNWFIIFLLFFSNYDVVLLAVFKIDYNCFIAAFYA